MLRIIDYFIENVSDLKFMQGSVFFLSSDSAFNYVHVVTYSLPDHRLETTSDRAGIMRHLVLKKNFKLFFRMEK